MPSAAEQNAALEAIDRILDRGGDADEVLRAVVERLHVLYPWAAIRFVEGDELVLGPASGEAKGEPARVGISFQGVHVAELEVEGAGSGEDECAFLERVARLVSAHCLVGWDTGGERWEP